MPEAALRQNAAQRAVAVPHCALRLPMRRFVAQRREWDRARWDTPWNEVTEVERRG